MRTIALSLLLASSACAIPTKVTGVNPDIARETVPIAIQSGLAAMDDPENKARMAALMSSPEMKQIEQELVSGVVDGSLAALSDESRLARIGELSSKYAGAMVAGIMRDVGPEIGPMVGSVMRNAVAGAMRQALAPENTQAIATAMTRDLGPAFQKVLAENLAPGIAAALQDEQVRLALGETARVLGRQVVLGVNDGMAEIQANAPKGGEPSTLESLGTLAEKSGDMASLGMWALGALVVVMAALLVKLLMQAKKYKSEVEEREAATRLMTEARRASEGKPWSEELLGALEQQLRSQPVKPKAGTRPLGRPPMPSNS